jgi:ubiquinone/menaquinone biosynthesis C-methylase UbiE
VRGVEQIPWLYDAACRVAEAAGLAAWRQWLTSGARGLTLDIGCGTGRNLPLYASDARVVGIERDRHVLRRARRRAPAVPLLIGRAEALPFRDETFDTVVSGLVFCSVDDPGRGLGEVRRVLTPQGELRMMEHVRSQTRLGAKLQDLLQPSWTWLTGGCRPNRDTEANVQAAGFAIDGDARRADGTMRRFAAHVSPPSPR